MRSPKSTCGSPCHWCSPESRSRMPGRRRYRHPVDRNLGRDRLLRPRLVDCDCGRADQSRDLRYHANRNGTHHARIHGKNCGQLGEPRRSGDGPNDAGHDLRWESRFMAIWTLVKIGLMVWGRLYLNKPITKAYFDAAVSNHS